METVGLFHETLHGLTSLPGHPRLWTPADEVEGLPPKFTEFVTSERCNNTSLRNILESTSRLYGFVIAFIIIHIGTTANLMASFLTSTETSLLSWKLNSDTLFAPGSKYGLSTSLWLREFLDRIGNTPPVKSPPITIPRSPFPSRSIILHGSPRSDQGISASISYERGI